MQENFNNEYRCLIDTLDDKKFVIDSLALMISQLSGEDFHILYRGLEYKEEKENILMTEGRQNLRTRLADARLTLPTDIIILNSISRLLS